MALSLSRSRSRKAGFLLTETLAAFAISAFVLLGLVSASSVLLRSVDRSAADTQNVDELTRTIATIDRDVSGLTRARWNGYEPQAFVFRGGPNSLFFAKAQRNPDGTRDTSVISLREIVAANGTHLMRAEARLSPRAIGFGELRFGGQRELGTGPARLRFYYVAASSGKDSRPRLRDWPMGTQLPAAVIVEAVDASTGRLFVSTRVSIHANADIGCIGEGDDSKTTLTALQNPGSTPRDPSAAASGASEQNGAATTRTASGDVPPGESDKFCGRADAEKAAAKPAAPLQAAARSER